MFQIVPPDVNVQFIPNAKKFVTFSGILMAVSLVLYLVMGLNFGIDFAGGTEMQVKFKSETPVQDIREAVESVENLPSVEVQSFGGLQEENEVLIKIGDISFVNESMSDKLESELKSTFKDQNLKNYEHKTAGGDTLSFATKTEIDEAKLKDMLSKYNIPAHKIDHKERGDRLYYTVVLSGLHDRVTSALEQKFGKDSFEILRDDSVGPKVGARLKEQSFYAIIYALGLILLYIAIRFDIRFAPGAIIALVHDVLITVGMLALFQIEFSTATIAALLTIVGYSLNDTIIVYDRIRENMPKVRQLGLDEVVNRSVNQTLSRTILTSGTTLLVVGSLMIFGGGVIFDFAAAMLMGIFVGTYSSIYIASPMMIYIYKRSGGEQEAVAQAQG